MGSDQLLKEYSKRFESCVKTQPLDEFIESQFKELGRRPVIAVDGYQWIYQILCVVQQLKANLTINTIKGDSEGRRYKTLFNQRINQFETLGARLIIVLDGANKPLYKRNKLTLWNQSSEGYWANCVMDICHARGISCVQAAGEGEAECAILQKQGTADWVFSNDSDCFVFGATKIINYAPSTKDGQRQLQVIRNSLSRWSFALYVLLVGGDYDTAGVSRFGAQVAMDIITKSDFGERFETIMKTRTADGHFSKKQMQSWREDLNHELKTNESQIFSKKWPSKQLGEDFPDVDVLRNYIQPEMNVNRSYESFTEKVYDTAKLFKYYRDNFADESYYTQYAKFSDMFTESIIVRRMFHGHGLDGAVWINRELQKGRYTVGFKPEVITGLNPLTDLNRKAPTSERKWNGFIFEHSQSPLVKEFNARREKEQQEAKAKSASSPKKPTVASRNNSRTAAGRTKSRTKKQADITNIPPITQYFARRTPNLSVKPDTAAKRSLSTTGPVTPDAKRLKVDLDLTPEDDPHLMSTPVIGDDSELTIERTRVVTPPAAVRERPSPDYPISPISFTD